MPVFTLNSLTVNPRKSSSALKFSLKLVLISKKI
jgi:hypothetical protein